MAIVYDLSITVTAKADETHHRGFTMTIPDMTHEKFLAIWPEVIYQTEMSTKLLNMEVTA